MKIIFHAHHATVSDWMRTRASRGVRKLSARLTRAVDAVVRFEQDGHVRRVEILLHAPKQRDLIASGESRFFGRALADALGRLQSQLPKKRAGRTRTRQLAAT